jgi:ankyrin repeat protein
VLHTAAIRNAAPVVQVLLSAEARIDERTADGSTPLHLAASAGACDALSVLLADRRVDVDVRDFQV